MTTVFSYEATYQADRRGYGLGPDLSLIDGRHHVPALPGCFADSAPDRWGRNLIRRRLLAEEDRDPGATVREIDYLLGVSDATRQGALRFAHDAAGPFLSDAGGVPQLVALPHLLASADAVDGDEDDLAAVKALLDAGSGSLGGARPKASVLDDGRLLIAKFPHRRDQWDVMAWEKTTLDLAERCGIRVPARRLVQMGGRSVLLLERFDRQASGRLGYISAMTMLRASDGAQADYSEVAEALSEHGSDVADDLVELWRRMVFSVVVNNVDDHLRNHGFLREGAGWRLSPAFDINPHPDVSMSRVTTIGFAADPLRGHDALLDVAPDFGLDRSSAAAVYAEVLEGTSGWRTVADGNGVIRRERELFAPALDRFRVAR